MSVALHGDGHGLRDDGMRPAAEQAPLAQAPDRREEQRDEEHADQGRDEHPEKDARADRVPARSARTARREQRRHADRKSTRLNSSHLVISYAVFCLKKKKKNIII